MKKKFAKRISSLFIDHSIMSFIIFSTCFALIFINTFFNQLEGTAVFIIVFVSLIIGLISVSFYLNKDIFGSRSFGKRKMNFIIINIESNSNASPIKCFLRNITFVIWPIEILFLYFNPERRLGDFIANTKVIDLKSNKINIIKYNTGTKIFSIFLGVVFIFFIIPLFALIKDYNGFIELLTFFKDEMI